MPQVRSQTRSPDFGQMKTKAVRHPGPTYLAGAAHAQHDLAVGIGKEEGQKPQKQPTPNRNARARPETAIYGLRLPQVRCLSVEHHLQT